MTEDQRPYLTLVEVIADGLFPHRATAADLRCHPLVVGLARSEDVSERRKKSIIEEARQRAFANLLRNNPLVSQQYGTRAKANRQRTEFFQTLEVSYRKLSELAKLGKVELHGKPGNAATPLPVPPSEFEYLVWDPRQGDDLVNKSNKTVWSQVFIQREQLERLKQIERPPPVDAEGSSRGPGRPRIHSAFKEAYLKLKSSGELPKRRQCQADKVKTLVREAALANGQIPPNNPEDSSLKERFSQWDKDKPLK